MNILFVCTGNTCRSPMAEGIFNAAAPAGFHASSAGMMAVSGGVSRLSESVCSQHGIDISAHEPTQMSGLLAREADLVLTMTRDHAEYLQWLYPADREKIFPLLAYAIGEDADVNDPYGGDETVYEACFTQLSGAIASLLERLEKAQ